MRSPPDQRVVGEFGEELQDGAAPEGGLPLGEVLQAVAVGHLDAAFPVGQDDALEGVVDDLAVVRLFCS